MKLNRSKLGLKKLARLLAGHLTITLNFASGLKHPALGGFLLAGAQAFNFQRFFRWGR